MSGIDNSIGPDLLRAVDLLHRLVDRRSVVGREGGAPSILDVATAATTDARFCLNQFGIPRTVTRCLTDWFGSSGVAR